ncbi:MAG: two-component system sensor histidine kinase RpfC [Gammaproteobacteria bacterium]|jgi:two-component system sensor histidine kinase RpfC
MNNYSLPDDPDRQAASRNEAISLTEADRIRTQRSQHEKTFAASANALSEVAQAKVRNWIHISVVAIAAIAMQLDPNIDPIKVLATAVVGLPAGAALYYWAGQLNSKDLDHKWRIGQRISSMVSDMFFITWVLHFGGVNFAGLFALYIWISVGYGIRYGLSYLYGTLSLSVICFATAAWFTPFWHSNPGLVAGMLFGLIIVPIYVGWLITQLQHAVAEKDLAYQAKSDFVAMMSHELRTPLHGIISTSDLLRGTAASPKQKEMIRIISTSSNSLLELINRVLDISKFESKSIALQQQPMDLHAVVNDTANIMWPQALKKGLSLQVYIDPEIQNSLIGSPHQLQEVLINLCGNAVKFTESGQVAVRVLFIDETSDDVAVRFEISDTGPGIPKLALPGIFEPFVQSDSPTTRKHGGTGLGTAFAKELIRLMGGNINVQSTEGVGTKFTINVKLQKLREREDIAPLFPFSVAGIGFEQEGEELQSTLVRFGTKIRLYPTTRLLSEFQGLNDEDHYPEAIFVNVNRFAENLRGVVREISKILPDRNVPIYACGDGLYKSSAIASGYSAFVTDLGDSKLIGRTLNMISALRHDSGESITTSTQKIRGLHILVAEDNATNQRIAQLVLEEAGHRCTIANDGDEALEALHEGSYDIAILDMHMPHRDGIEVAKIYNFSHFDAESRIPLIMMTADGRYEARQEARDSGIDAFVTKPITPQQLVDVIDSVATSNKVEIRDHYFCDDLLTNSQVVPAGDELHKPIELSRSRELLNQHIIEELAGYMDRQEQKTFFEDFISDGSTYISTLVDCNDLQKVKAAKDEMHAFAGACLVIGADLLAEKARLIEMQESSIVLRDHSALHDEILSLFSATADSIRSVYD